MFPTEVRALAMGMFSAGARVGALTTPFVAQVCSVVSSPAECDSALSIHGQFGIIVWVVVNKKPLCLEHHFPKQYYG